MRREPRVAILARVVVAGDPVPDQWSPLVPPRPESAIVVWVHHDQAERVNQLVIDCFA
jgi:hypothetical protein